VRDRDSRAKSLAREELRADKPFCGDMSMRERVPPKNSGRTSRLPNVPPSTPKRLPAVNCGPMKLLWNPAEALLEPAVAAMKAMALEADGHE
jgi:hypothetical protein